MLRLDACMLAQLMWLHAVQVELAGVEHGRKMLQAAVLVTIGGFFA
jgi:hypothetical protein